MSKLCVDDVWGRVYAATRGGGAALGSAGDQVLETEASLAPASADLSSADGGLIGGVSGSRGVQPDTEAASR